MNHIRSWFTKRIHVHLKMSVGAIVYAIAFVLLMLYVFWEVYWYKRVGYAAIKWHTHLMLYLVLWPIVTAPLFFIVSKTKQERWLLSISTLLGTLFFLEALLIWSGVAKTYMENRAGTYLSVFNYTPSGEVYAYSPYSTHLLSTSEYDYPRYSNADGLSDVDFVIDTTRVVVQTYGDSFTEGDGAPADSAYPAILQRLLGDRFVVQNFGLCGNDPGYYIRQLQGIGIKYKPQICVMCYSTGDYITDFFTRGGVKRYDFGYHHLQPPWWEPLYAISYISRYFFHLLGYEYGSFFMQQKEIATEIEKLKPEWNHVFMQLGDISDSIGCKILLLKKPEKGEILKKSYDFDFSFFEQMVDTQPVFKRYDLLTYYTTTASLNTPSAVDSLFWQKDGHHNSKGYYLMAKGVFQGLKESGIVQ